jgi:RNA polymerase sigma factor (sigma-70 family)
VDKTNYDILSSVYNEYVDELYTYGCKFTPDKELIKDCIHDIFVKLYEKEDFSSILNLKFYILRAFKNRLLDELEKVMSVNLEDVPFLYAQTASGEDTFIQEDKNRQIKLYVEKIFENLTNRQREIVFLYYIEELSPEEIACMLKINNQTVRNTVHEAIVRLRKRLGTVPPDFMFLFVL